ncbi:Na+/H+ antiporter subunit E [Nitrolancea hollandica]|uniref:Na+/H+ antiporter subunit E n=1 Tax=Nitrolancea hollandica Lb TaxID=1129897 RepID=I4EJ78_9BACT
MTSWLITLAPGSVLVDVDWERGVMLFHLLDASDPDATRATVARFYERYQRAVFP